MRVVASKRLSAAVTLTAVLLATMVVLALGGISYLVMRGQITASIKRDLYHEAMLMAEYGGSRLRAVVTTLSALATNSLIVNALMDSHPRRTYLEPFLQDLRQINDVPTTVTLTDFTGAPIAGPGMLPTQAQDWVQYVIEQGQTWTETILQDAEVLVLIAEPIHYARTASPEGALVYTFSLARVLDNTAGGYDRPSSLRLAYRGNHGRALYDDGQDPSEALAGERSAALIERVPMQVPPVLLPLELTVEALAAPERLRAPIQRLFKAYVLIGTTALLLVAVLSTVAGQRLTRPLRRLETVASAVVASNSFSHRFEGSGPEEIRQLGQAFNHMLAHCAQAYETLQAQEGWLRSLIDNALSVVICLSPEGRILEFNPEAERLYGRKRADVLGADYVTLCLPEASREVVARDIAKVLRGEPSRAFENAVLAADGQERTLLWNVSRLLDAQGKPAGIIAIGQDISVRKQAEESLAERSRLALLSADIGVALNASDELPAMLQRCTTLLVTHLDSVLARIWTLNETDQVLELQASAGLYTHINGLHSRVPVGQWKIGRIAATRQPHLTNAVLSDPHISDKEWARREGMMAFAGYPLILGDRLLGVVALFARHPLASVTLTALAAVSDALALGIARLRMEETLRASLAEKELLLKEIHHRVKNNMQVISSLLRLQSEEIDDPRYHALFDECQHRVRSMALIHERLYRSPTLATLDFSSYLHELTGMLVRSYGQEGVQWHIEAEEAVALDLDTAIPLGLMLNELVSNALKHAFPDGRAGRLTVRLRAHGQDMLRLTVQDDGVGFPEGLDWDTSRSLGLRIVRLLTRQMRGAIEVHCDRGTAISIVFSGPASPLLERQAP